MNLFRPISRLLHRSLDAAAGGRRWTGAKIIPNWNNTIATTAAKARLRSRFQAANNAYLSRAVNSIVSNLIGTGIKPQSQHKDEAARALLHRLWAIWTDHADPAGRADFYGLQALVARAMVTDGECFVWMKTGGPRGFTLQLVSADQVDASINRELGGGARIVAGIEFAASGERIAYHVYPAPPGDAAPISLTPVRVPAADMVHVFDALAPGQVRGLSWFAPILLRLNEIDKLEDAILLKQQMAAMLAGFITTHPEADISDYEAHMREAYAGSGRTKGLPEIRFESGTMKSSPKARM
jgi:lambda family phage portal protein